MKLPNIREKLREILTRENLLLLAKLAKRKAIKAVGRVVMDRKNSKEIRMRPYTLRVGIDVDADSKDIIDRALDGASGGAREHSQLVLDFLNLSDSVRFCGVMVKTSARSGKNGNGLKPFTVNVHIYVEAPKKSVFDEGIAMAKQEGESYAPAVLGFLGLGGRVKFRGIDIDVTKGHPA